MTASAFIGSSAYSILVNESGSLSTHYYVYKTIGVRPVISLKADALMYDEATSNGSMGHPFIINNSQ